MSRQLFASAAAIAFVIAFAAPAPAEEHPEALVKRIGQLPGELIKAKKTDEEIVDALFLATVTRLPKENEKETALKHVADKKDRKQAYLDLAWALVNTKEFLVLHGLDKDTTAALQLLNRLTREWEKEEKKEDKK